METTEEKKPIVKQVIVVRKDLNMRRGKEDAQAAHAAMAWLTNRLVLTNRHGSEGNREYRINFTEAEEAWVKGTFTKITLQVEGEEALKELHLKAHAQGLYSHIIIDKGKTEFHGVPTATCLALGPDWDYIIDPLTKDLELR